MNTKSIEWVAEQVCGQCGEGVFLLSADYGFGPSCSVCEHVHPMNSYTLDEREEYVFRAGSADSPSLHVIAYEA